MAVVIPIMYNFFYIIFLFFHMWLLEHTTSIMPAKKLYNPLAYTYILRTNTWILVQACLTMSSRLIIRLCVGFHNHAEWEQLLHVWYNIWLCLLFPCCANDYFLFYQSPELNVSDLKTLKAELDIPIPDPEKEKEKEKKVSIFFR